MSDENQYPEQAQQTRHLQYTPEPQESTHAEVEVGATATQIVAFDPFADEGDEQEPGTAVVALDPFTDDDDDDKGFDIARLLGHGGSSSSMTTCPGTQTPDPSMTSHRKALEDFRRRRSNAHRGCAIADGMVYLPYVTTQDPRDAVMSDEKIRVASKPAPSLKTGGTMADRYEVVGPIAHDGLDWIYLMTDHNVSGHQVMLRGMMAAKNERDLVVVQAEREFLAEISYLRIVRIINFIDETDANSATGPIVMEYVGGPSLCKQRWSCPDGVTPCNLAIGYILGLLPAPDYPHSHGVVYNDLKPGNVLFGEDRVALIDAGAVIGTGACGHIYGTSGFQAPEIVTTGPTIASNICTVDRTLASLILKLPATSGVYDPGLPSPVEESLFHRLYSLYRSLLRAYHGNPGARFGSAEEMSVQLVGILREILTVCSGVQFLQTVSNFLPQRFMYGIKRLVSRTDQLADGITRGVEITPQEMTFVLPVPLINPTDPDTHILNASSFTEPNELIKTLTNALPEPEYDSSMETPLGIVRAKLDLGLIDEARNSLCDVSERLQRNWHYHWHEGVTYLLLDQFNGALTSSHHMLIMLPGEPILKLALAATLELIQQRLGVANVSLLEPAVAYAVTNLNSALDNIAAGTPEIFSLAWASESLSPRTIRFNTLRLYAVAWTTSPVAVSPTFGLARQLASEYQHEMAISQLDRTPGSSRHHRMVRLTTILILTSGIPSELTKPRIRHTVHRLVGLPTNEPCVPQLRVAVMVSALNWLRSSNLDHAASSDGFFDTSFTVAGLREGLEKDLRILIRSSQFPRHHHNLVDITNLIRLWTWRQLSSSPLPNLVKHAAVGVSATPEPVS